MKRFGNALNLLSRLSDAWMPWLLLALVVPVLLLLGTGFYALFALDLLRWFLGALLLGAVLAALLWWLTSRRGKARMDLREEQEEALVHPSKEWTEFDLKVWNEVNGIISEQIEADPKWQDLKDLALVLVTETAYRYHEHDHSAFAFTVPSLLKLIEEVSRRYRRLLLEHVPFSERIRLSQVKWLYGHRDKMELAQTVLKGYRVARLFNPTGTGILAEARTQLMDRFFGRLGVQMQRRLKKAFLQEVVSVAIGLYGGHFEVADEDLEASEAAQADEERMAPPLEPLRIGLLGQVSSGKSSLINALIDDAVAEVSVLPSTDGVQVHQCVVDGETLVHLIDLPGLDGQEETQRQLLKELAQYDLVLWVLRANQPAREQDKCFKKDLEAHFSSSENRFRRAPSIMWILSQVDRLKPVSEWCPPYDLSTASTGKAGHIVQALEYNRKLLGLAELTPLALPVQGPVWNLDAVRERIGEYYEEGIQTQLNRRRHEACARLDVGEQLRRLRNAGRAAFGLMMKDNQPCQNQEMR